MILFTTMAVTSMVTAAAITSAEGIRPMARQRRAIGITSQLQHTGAQQMRKLLSLFRIEHRGHLK